MGGWVECGGVGTGGGAGRGGGWGGWVLGRGQGAQNETLLLHGLGCLHLLSVLHRRNCDRSDRRGCQAHTSPQLGGQCRGSRCAAGKRTHLFILSATYRLPSESWAIPMGSLNWLGPVPVWPTM